jgi:hypothetical protein
MLSKRHNMLAFVQNIVQEHNTKSNCSHNSFLFTQHNKQLIFYFQAKYIFVKYHSFHLIIFSGRKSEFAIN